MVFVTLIAEAYQPIYIGHCESETIWCWAPLNMKFTLADIISYIREKCFARNFLIVISSCLLFISKMA